jgi:hypothetical protein
VTGTPSPLSALVVDDAGPAHADALGALFERTGVPCHCRYWHFAGDKNAWLARCALEPGENRAEMDRALRRPGGSMTGMVALTAEGEAVGWMKQAPAALMGKLYDQRL